ncbi:hypothetical protein [Stomatobaculum longum]|jgi:hypothetical protein|uniref:hypothetical protein n=1 Tax=Stomatobaculum longum TaxID=796942 RepID=UPI0028E7DA49|nr:hypothetical protein [Stomatobaculum longum]
MTPIKISTKLATKILRRQQLGIPSFHRRYGKRCAHFEHIVFLRNWEINVLPFSLHGFPAPFRRRFPALLLRVIAWYPMQTVMRFSRCNGQNGNQKAVTKQPPCLRFFWKVMLVGYVTAESQDVQPRRAGTNM